MSHRLPCASSPEEPARSENCLYVTERMVRFSQCYPYVLTRTSKLGPGLTSLTVRKCSVTALTKGRPSRAPRAWVSGIPPISIGTRLLAKMHARSGSVMPMMCLHMCQPLFAVPWHWGAGVCSCGFARKSHHRRACIVWAGAVGGEAPLHHPSHRKLPPPTGFFYFVAPRPNL